MPFLLQAEGRFKTQQRRGLASSVVESPLAQRSLLHWAHY